MGIWSKKFDPELEFVARRALVQGDGSLLAPGDDVAKATFLQRRLRQLYDQRIIAEKEAWNEYHALLEAYEEKTSTLVPLLIEETPAAEPVAVVETPAAEPVVALPGLPGFAPENIGDGQPS